MAAFRRELGRLRPESTVFLLCDVQERFRDLIWQMPTVIRTSGFLVAIAQQLKIPVVVTEQYRCAQRLLLHKLSLDVFARHRRSSVRVVGRAVFGLRCAWRAVVRCRLTSSSSPSSHRGGAPRAAT